MTDHAVKDAFLQVRSGFPGKIEHIAHDGAQAHLTARLEEVVRRAGGDAPAIRNDEQAWVPTDEQSATSGALRVLTGRPKFVLRVVRIDDDANSLVVIGAPSAPVQGGVEGINSANAGEGHVNDVAVLEAVLTVARGVTLREHVNDVRRGGLGSVERGFGAKVETADAPRVEAVAVDQPHHGHGAHGRRVLVNVGDGHRGEAQSLVQFVIIRLAEFSKLTHVEVQARNVNGQVVNTDGNGISLGSHMPRAVGRHMNARVEAKRYRPVRRGGHIRRPARPSRPVEPGCRPEFGPRGAPKARRRSSTPRMRLRWHRLRWVESR